MDYMDNDFQDYIIKEEDTLNEQNSKDFNISVS